MDLTVIRIDPRQSAILKHGRAVDQRGDFSKRFGSREHGLRGGSGIAEVRGDSNRLATTGFDAANDGLRLDTGRPVMHDNGQTTGGHGERDLATDAAGGASDDGDAAGFGSLPSLLRPGKS
jgi:hypothetical protein